MLEWGSMSDPNQPKIKDLIHLDPNMVVGNEQLTAEIHGARCEIARRKGEPEPPFQRIFITHPETYERFKRENPERVDQFEQLDVNKLAAELSEELNLTKPLPDAD